MNRTWNSARGEAEEGIIDGHSLASVKTIAMRLSIVTPSVLFFLVFMFEAA